MLDENFNVMLHKHFLVDLGRLTPKQEASRVILEYYSKPGHLLQYLLTGKGMGMGEFATTKGCSDRITWLKLGEAGRTMVEPISGPKASRCAKITPSISPRSLV